MNDRNNTIQIIMISAIIGLLTFLTLANNAQHFIK